MKRASATTAKWVELVGWVRIVMWIYFDATRLRGEGEERGTARLEKGSLGPCCQNFGLSAVIQRETVDHVSHHV